MAKKVKQAMAKEENENNENDSVMAKEEYNVKKISVFNDCLSVSI